MLHTTPATNVRFLLLKSGPGSGAKIAHQAGYAFYGSRWHKISADKPAPKGAPVASHPEAGGAHIPKAHFTDDQWSQLKLPDTNVNAKSFNNALAKLKEWSDAGNVTAILGAGFGTNTYGKKLAAIANSLLAAHGSTHKVTAGQKAGEHGAVLAAPAGAKPAEAASADAPLGAYSAEPVEAPAIGAVPDKFKKKQEPAALPDLDSPEDMAADHTKPAPAAKPEHFEFNTGDVFKLDSQYQKMNAGEWTVYNISPDGTQVYMHKVGAKVPNQSNSATIPASTLAEAIAKGTAKKVTDTVSKPAAPAPKDTDPMSDWTAFTGKHWGDVQEVDDAAPFLKDPKKAGPAALSAYGSSGFTEINSGPSAPVSKALLSYIGKLPAFDSSKQLHRVMGFDSSDAVDGFLKQLAPSATEPGAQIKTVSSWTTNDPSAPDQTPMNNIALDLAEQFGDHKVFLTLESGHQSAKDVSFLYSKDGKSKGGTDVLLPHGTRLDVVSVKKDGLNTHVVVREVHEGDTKPAADGGTLVLKDGHWVKQGEPAPTGNLAMPDFQEGKTVTGVKALYEKVGQKIIDFAQAGDVASLEAIAEPGKKMWAGKTPNSKLLLALRSAALAQAKGEPVPAAVVAPAVEAPAPAASDAGPKEGNTKPAVDGGVLVLKDGHWTKQGGDDTSALFPAGSAWNDVVEGAMLAFMKGDAEALADFESEAAASVSEHGKVALAYIQSLKSSEPVAKKGDVFKFKSEYQKMNKGEWTVYGVSPDGQQVYMHKVGAKVPNQSNSATIPPAILSLAIIKGTAKKQGAQGGDAPAGAPTGSTVEMDGPLSAGQLGKLQSIPWFKQKLPAENTNAKSHNVAVAKIETMAFAGDKDGLQAFINTKAGAKQTYAKKQHLLAQTALAALQAGAPSAEPSLAGKPAYDHIAHTMKAGGSGLSAADQWIAANPGEWGELNDALSAHGFGHLADYGPAGAPDAGTAPPQGPTVNTPVPADVKKTIDGMASQGNKAGLESVAANNPNNPHVAAYAQKKLDEFSDPTADTPLLPAQLDALQKFSPSQLKVVSGTGLPPNVQAWIDKKLAEPTKVKVDAPLYTNTEPGHNKFWSVSTNGKMLKTEYGKIGTMGTSTVKEFATAQEAMDAAVKLMEQKKSKGYKHQGSVKHEHNVAAVDVAPMGGWSHKASDPGMSGAPTLSSDDGLIAFDPESGHAEYHDSASLESMDPMSVVSADSLHDLVQKMAANGQPVPPLAALQKLSPSFKASDLPAGPKDGDTKMGADGMLVFKDGRWHKQGEPEPTAKKLTQWGVADVLGDKVPTNSLIDAAKKAAKEGDADGINAAWWAADAKGFAKTAAAIGKLAAAMGVKIKPLPQAAAAPSVPAPVAATAAPSADAWNQTGPQLGSNPGGKFKDASGQEWYIKWPDDAEAVKSEVLAAKLYAMAGLSSQDCMLVTKGGKVAIATKWVDIKKAESAAALAAVDGVQSGFAVDAWLGNWDVIGQSLDNLQVGEDGKAHRVDAGGSLEYRAQGEKKPFGAKVEEIDTLRDKKKNPKAAAVFGLMSDADITASVAKVAAISDSQIRALVFEHGPGDDAARKALAATLIARKEDLLTRFPAAAKPTKKLLDRSALPVNPASIPKPHDFENWNGPGKGLSSKDHVNKANAAVEAQMQALAQSGNMIALQAFKFAQGDKETGALTGEMVPVSKHPSKHVQQYQQDLLQILDEVANPPEPLKVFRETDVGTLAALNAAFPPKPFGTTVSKVASNEKLGFWVALGAVAGAQKFAPSKFSNYSSAAVAAAKEKYASASKLAKHFIKSVQSSGSYNDLFRDGKTHDSSGNDLKDVAKAALAHATEMPEGTTLYRWQKMSPQMLQHIMSAKDGTVFQATGPMCTSYSATATSGFGTHRVVVRYAKGAKAVESFGSGGFSSEKEVTTLPNARFVILSKKMVPDQEHGKPGSERLELEILMLPPDLGL